MDYREMEEAAESVQRMWRGYLGRKEGARIQLNRERDRIRSKQHRKQQPNNGKEAAQYNHVHNSTAPNSDSDQDSGNVVTYKAVKRATKLGTYEKKGNKSTVSQSSTSGNNWSDDRESPIEELNVNTKKSAAQPSSGGKANSHPPAVTSAFALDDPLVASHLSVIAEEDEMLRDSLASTTHSMFNKKTLNSLQAGNGSATNSPKTGRKSGSGGSQGARASYVADSLEGPAYRAQAPPPLDRQSSTRTTGSRVSDVDTEAEDLPLTARTPAGSSEADSIEYGQFVKTDRFEDFIAGLADDYNAWEDPNSQQEQEDELQDSLRRSGKYANIITQAAVPSKGQGMNTNNTRGGATVNTTAVEISGASGTSGIPRFTSRKSTAKLQAFDSDGSLSQRVDSHGAPSMDLHSPPRAAAAAAAKQLKVFSPEKPFVPSVRDLLAVSPISSKTNSHNGAYFDDSDQPSGGESDKNYPAPQQQQQFHHVPAVGMQREAPATMLSKLEQAQLMYENSVRRNFPALKPQQPGLILHPSHSRSNSNVSGVNLDSGSQSPLPSARSNNAADRSPRGARLGFPQQQQQFAQPASPTPYGIAHNNGTNLGADGYEVVRSAAPEFPQQIPKQGYFKQAQQAGSQIPLLYQQGAPAARGGFSLMQPAEAQRPPSQQSQGQTTPRTIRIASQASNSPHYPNQSQPPQQQGVPPQPLRLTPPPQQAAPAARRPQPGNGASNAAAADVRAGAGGGYAAEYNASLQQREGQQKAPAARNNPAPVVSTNAPSAVSAPAGGGLGRFSNLPSKLIPQVPLSKAPAALAAVKPASGKNKPAPLGQTKLTELQEQKLLEEIEELNRIQLQKMQELAALEEREKAAAVSPKGGAGQGQGQARKPAKEVDPQKEKDKRAFKAGAKDVNPTPVLAKVRAKPAAANVAQNASEWQDAMQRDGVEVHKLAAAKNKNGNLLVGQGNAANQARPVSPVVNIHQQLLGKLPAAVGSEAADPSNAGGYANVGYLQVYKKKQDGQRGGSNPRGAHRRNASGDEVSVNSNNDAQSEGRLFQNRRAMQQRDAQYAQQQYEETTSLPAIPSARNVKSSGSARVAGGGAGTGPSGAARNAPGDYGHSNAGAGQYYAEEEDGGGAPSQFVHPLDGQNRRVLNASRHNTMSAPSRLHDHSDGYHDEGSEYDHAGGANYGPSGLPSLPNIGRGNGYEAAQGMVPIYNMQKNISVGKGYSKR